MWEADGIIGIVLDVTYFVIAVYGEVRVMNRKLSEHVINDTEENEHNPCFAFLR
jgi:hypothetical protein